MSQYTKVKKLSLWLFGAVAALLVYASPAKAVTSQALDIRVSISATKSLSVNTTHYNFGAMNVNTAAVSASSITVTNDSGALVETYTIQGADANSTGGGTNWTIAASTGSLDEYVLAAQFGNAQPGNVDSAWANDALTTSVIACTDANLGNGTPGETGLSVSPLAGQRDRALWFRIITPLLVTDVTQRRATITLAVQ